jgi:diaminopimelate epimerase
MDYSVSVKNDTIVVEAKNTNYIVDVGKTEYDVSLSRTGGQGSKGNDVTSAYVDTDNHLIIVISDALGNLVEEIDVGNITGNIILSIDELSDVAINFLGEGYLLVYNATANRWESKEVKVENLADVEVTAYEENDVLLYNSVDSKFNNHKLTTAKLSNINETVLIDGSMFVYDITTGKYVTTTTLDNDNLTITGGTF